MLVPNNGNWGRSNSTNGGWAMAAAVVLLMGGLVFLTSGRSGTGRYGGYAQHASVHYHLRK